MASENEERPLSQKIAETAGEVIIEAVKFGLDEAGTRLLGPTAWNGFKRIVTPVIKRLQERFPALAFGNPKDQAAQAAANEASVYLRTSPEMHLLLIENFDKLSAGHEDILRGIHRLERTVEKTSQDVKAIASTAREILSEVQHMQHEAAPAALPTFIDMSDFIEEVLLFARSQARREGKQFSVSPAFTTILMIAAIEQFKQRVLEDGITAKTYKTTFKPYGVTMTAHGKYVDPDGKTCRKYTIMQPDFVHDLSKSISLSHTYCREEGIWIPIQ